MQNFQKLRPNISSSIGSSNNNNKDEISIKAITNTKREMRINQNNIIHNYDYVLFLKSELE